MDCPSESALLGYNGEISPADDVRSIVSVTVDREPNSIMVTYPHIVQQIKLSKKAPYNEARLEWRTKYLLTSGVVYDAHGDRYVAVCGGDTVRVAATVAQLDSADKYTFRIPIYTIIIRPNKDSLIVFQNGDCLTLSYGLEHCKSYNRRAPTKALSIIVEATSYTRNGRDYVCFITKDKSNSYNVINYPLKNEMCDYHNLRISRVSESRNSTKTEVSVKGCCIVGGATENPSVCFTWSDANVGMYDVVKDCWKLKYYPLLILRQYDSTLVCLKKNTILIYGKFDNKYQSEILNSSYTMTIHKSLPKWWSHSYVLHEPYSKHTKAYDCDDHVVLVEPSKVTAWNITLTNFERLPCFLNDSKVLIRQLRPEKFLPIFGNPKKYDHLQPLTSRWMAS